MANVVAEFPPNNEKEYECQCARCGSSCDWQECHECGGDGVTDHDCGDDFCCCLCPEDNVNCPTCSGHGGWYGCLSSREYCEANPIERPERDQPYRRGQIEWFEVKSASR